MPRSDHGQRVEVCESIDLDLKGRFLAEVREVPIERGALALTRRRPAARKPAAAVLLIHGYGQNHHAFHVSRRSFLNALADRGLDTFAIDLRGVGMSARLGAPPPAGVWDYVERDLPAAIEDIRRASGLSRVYLVGHSTGAAAACAFAGRHPGVVAGVVTISGLYDFGRRNLVIRLLGHAATAASDLGALRSPQARVRVDLAGWLLAATLPAFDSRLARFLPLQAWAPGSTEPDVLEEAIRASFEPASLPLTLDLAARAAGRDIRDANGRPLLAEFERHPDLPLLVVTADADALVSPVDARAAHERSASRDRTIRHLVRAEAGTGFGHMDVLLGRCAPAFTWRVVGDWIEARL